jgi:hypothetical protein
MTVIIMYAVVVLAVLRAVVVAAMKDVRLAKVAARASAARPSQWK